MTAIPRAKRRIEIIGRHRNRTVKEFEFEFGAESTTHRTRPRVVIGAVEKRRNLD
ncbi:hypothetical protein A2U01_0093629, partial [Trifolium medium]|nr:hypothetical protein [Trifolium medium]